MFPINAFKLVGVYDMSFAHIRRLSDVLGQPLTSPHSLALLWSCDHVIPLSRHISHPTKRPQVNTTTNRSSIFCLNEATELLMVGWPCTGSNCSDFTGGLAYKSWREFPSASAYLLLLIGASCCASRLTPSYPIAPTYTHIYRTFVRGHTKKSSKQARSEQPAKPCGPCPSPRVRHLVLGFNNTTSQPPPAPATRLEQASDFSRRCPPFQQTTTT